jgi:hypothetical protein
VSLSPAERAALARQDAPLLALPLREGPEPHSMAAHLRQVTRLLKAASPSPCLAAVSYLTALYNRSLPPRPDIACRKGCAHCCVQTVLVSAAEAFALAAALGDRRAAVAQALRATGPRRLGEPKADWRPCVVLDAANACSVYLARPLPCHGFVSFDLAACIAFFDRREDAIINGPTGDARLLSLCRMMLCAAHLLTGHGLQQGYELGSALSVILDEPDAEARWLAGENILAGVDTGPAMPDYFAREIAAMAAFVGPTL